MAKPKQKEQLCLVLTSDAAGGFPEGEETQLAKIVADPYARTRDKRAATIRLNEIRLAKLAKATSPRIQ